MKIDLVYTWVDGSDPNWQERRNLQLKKMGSVLTNSTDEALFMSNEELKFSLRSVESFAPWVNQIYLVTDNQVPDWLDIKNSRIKVVDHTEIFTDRSHLPCYSARAIEAHLHHIPDLSENFLYFNDDMFLGKLSKQSDFFDRNETPLIYTSEIIAFPNKKLYDIELRDIAKRNNHQYSIINTRSLLRERFGKSVYFRVRHGIKPLKKSILSEIEEIFKDDFNETSKNHFRTNEDILPIHLFDFYSVIKKAGKTKYLFTVDKKSSFVKFLSRFYKTYTFGFINLHEMDIDEHLIRIKNSEPLMFCLNQTPGTPLLHLEKVKRFLNDYFPNKSSFEK